MNTYSQSHKTVSVAHILALALAATILGCSASSDGGSSSPADSYVAADTGASSEVDTTIDAASTPETAVAPAAEAGAPEVIVVDAAVAKDVAGSAECKAFCAALTATCTTVKCTESYECAIKAGSCAAAAKATLKCKAETGKFYCGKDGWSLVSSCKNDPTLCT